MSTQETLTKFGFDPSTSEIYVILANNGEMTVPQILEKTDLSRASIYDSLSQLLAGDYLEYRKEGRNAYYKPLHPNKLFNLIEEKKRENTLLEQEMKEDISSLIGAYNLNENKPGVRFFEGEEGFREALNDSLSATEEIYTFVDIEALTTYAKDINKEYVKKRQDAKIHKKILAIDTPTTREYLSRQSDFTEVRYLPKDINPFSTGMEIYNNKISYFTLRKNNTMAIIIDDPDIYTMHRHLFEAMWKLSS